MRPKCLLFAEGTSHLDEVISLAAKSLSIPTLRIQYGQTSFIDYSFCHMSFDYMLTWGEGFVNRLRPFNGDCAFVVTGNHQLDGLIETEVAPALTAFKGNSPLALVFTQPLGLSAAMDHRLLADSIDRLLGMNASCKVLIRHHPSDWVRFLKRHYQNHERVLVTEAKDFALAELLRVADASFGFYSSTLGEGIAAGVPPVVYELPGREIFFPHPILLNACILVRTPTEAAKSLDLILRETADLSTIRDGMKRYRDEFFSSVDGNSTDRVVGVIRDIVHYTRNIP
jgi:hypothetical protein